MNTDRSTAARRALAAAMCAALAAGIAFSAHAQERHHREAGEPFRTPHMVFDNRYRHGHYYPTVGYSVTVLPPGYLSIGFGARRFFFHGGVWFQPAASGFVVVRPPLGVVVPVLPPAYTSVWIAGSAYYYANDVYYVEAPGGYAVTAAPGIAEPGAAPSVPPAPPVSQAPPASAAPKPASGMWYYCESSKSYYPYVSECREGWRSVSPMPPGVR